MLHSEGQGTSTYKSKSFVEDELVFSNTIYHANTTAVVLQEQKHVKVDHRARPYHIYIYMCTPSLGGGSPE